MKIEKIISQHRRDFTAIFTCEHCSHSYEGSGYDDRNYHQYVLPEMECGSCGKTSDKSYKPRGTKYPEGFQI